jgi:protein-L-isoaspartate(D-aspartate) O-methyltransferase
LAVGGRLFAVIGDAPAMKAMLYTKTSEQSTIALELFETVLAPLINAEQPSRFAF